MSTAPSLPRNRAWLRVLVLMLAVLVPGAHAEVHAAPGMSVEIVEHDVLDAAARPPAQIVRRAVVRLRPAPLQHLAPGATPSGHPPVPPRAPYAPHTLRSVILRC
jgi:hypothetical protein